ncbi:hypothetical protein M0R45_019017 [Rubus argutus]|uniref:Uncharacterized protein n=1 Tax=Rubus argutus TaxID=59490 RepID=A0AAW1X4X9_RUBAR
MGAIDMPLVGSFSPVATEIMALWADLQFITDAAILPVLTEMDCWELVVLVYLKDRCWAEWVVWWRKSTLCYKLSARDCCDDIVVHWACNWSLGIAFCTVFVAGKELELAAIVSAA